MDTKDSGKEQRCPHYQLYSEPLEMEGPPSFLAIRRCLLTERQVRLLSDVPDGQALADKLVVHLSSEKSYAFVGPDLEAVTQQTCTVQRCEERCTPAYVQRLKSFEVDDPGLGTVTCQDEENEEIRRTTEAESASCGQT